MANGGKLPEQEAREAAEKTAGEYAWNYFQYHAGQRQSVFRFFVTLVGIATLAYGYSFRGQFLIISPQGNLNPPSGLADKQGQLRFLVGCFFLVVSFLFWRLDRRSRQLIKNSELALRKIEDCLSTHLDNEQTIKLMELGDRKNARWPFSHVESFRQVYGLIFLLVGLAGCWMILNYFELL